MRSRDQKIPVESCRSSVRSALQPVSRLLSGAHNSSNVCSSMMNLSPMSKSELTVIALAALTAPLMVWPGACQTRSWFRRRGAFCNARRGKRSRLPRRRDDAL